MGDELGLSRPGGPCDPNADIPMGPIEERVHDILENAEVSEAIYDEVDRIVGALEADNEALRLALEPFAEMYNEYLDAYEKSRARRHGGPFIPIAMTINTDLLKQAALALGKEAHDESETAD